MANQVYANGREISCKAADGKSIAAFPDVCFTPPQTPATPPGVPIPYPNTGVSSDTSDGSKNVKISGKEIMMKDSSPFSKTSGNEAGSAPKKGVITSKNTGKAFFNSWSMDVKVEGSNVVRHLDIMTHNHGSKPGNTPPWPYADQASVDGTGNHPCAANRKTENEKCRGMKKAQACADTPEGKACQQARKCKLVPCTKGSKRCCPGQTAHHLVEVHGFCHPGNRDLPMSPFDGSKGGEAYNQHKAPGVCAKCPMGSRYHQEHGDLHAVQGIKENAAIAGAANPKMAWNYAEARQAGIDAHSATFPDANCSEECIKAQLDDYHHNKVGVKDGDPLRTEPVHFGKKDTDQEARGKDLIKNLDVRRGTAYSSMD